MWLSADGHFSPDTYLWPGNQKWFMWTQKDIVQKPSVHYQCQSDWDLRPNVWGHWHSSHLAFWFLMKASRQSNLVYAFLSFWFLNKWTKCQHGGCYRVQAALSSPWPHDMRPNKSKLLPLPHQSCVDRCGSDPELNSPDHFQTRPQREI